MEIIDIAQAIFQAKAAGWKQADLVIANTIRAAARRGAIPGARQGVSGRWYFWDSDELISYLRRSCVERRGRPNQHKRSQEK
jgi:hypothetical protein